MALYFLRSVSSAPSLRQAQLLKPNVRLASQAITVLILVQQCTNALADHTALQE